MTLTLLPLQALAASGGTVNIPLTNDYTGLYKTDGTPANYAQVFITTGDNFANISGGLSYYVGADYNTVTMDGGSADQVFGGNAFTYNDSSRHIDAKYNTVHIRGGSVSSIVVGGLSQGLVLGSATAKSGDALYNRVIISGGVVKEVYGGYASASSTFGDSITGDAKYNEVIISGGTVNNYVVGGYLTSATSQGSATYNTVRILGSPHFGSDAKLYGGLSRGVDVREGNTLEVFTSGIVVNNIGNFQNYHFAFAHTDGARLLSVTETNTAYPVIFKTGDVVRVFYGGTHDEKAVPGYNVLLKTAMPMQGLTSDMLPDGQMKRGVSVFYDYALSVDDPVSPKEIRATVTNIRANPQSKAISESRAAGLALVSAGADFIAGAGIASMLGATNALPSPTSTGLSGGDPAANSKLVPFFALSGSSMRYNTNSHVDVDSVSFMAGLAKKWETAKADIFAGVFFESAFGSYKNFHNTNVAPQTARAIPAL